MIWSVSGHASAFQAPARFLETAATGGSDGRFFTGSPVDRYTCKVCHTLGSPPRLQITGLPVSGYLPGQTYQIVIDWDDTLKSIAFNLEMTDAAGHAVGTFSVPPIAELTPGDLCASTGVPAVVTTPAGQRTMALMSECGARQATFRWTAPASTAANPAPLSSETWFSGSLVASDGDGSVRGDSVTDISRVFGVSGRPVPAAVEVSGGCNVSPTASPAGHLGSVVLCLVGVIRWRWGRARKRAQ